jgi:hypothetical protein
MDARCDLNVNSAACCAAEIMKVQKDLVTSQTFVQTTSKVLIQYE